MTRASHYDIVHNMNNRRASDEVLFRILDEFSRQPVVSQRALADRLGIALGLVNAYIKRLYRKGYIKVKNLSRKRIKYIITPNGLAEKARLTYGYMHRSINYFREVRRRIEQTYSLMHESDVKNILLWGDGEIAELCYISTRGLPIEIVGIVGEETMENGFFGHHILTKEDIGCIKFDAILVSSLEDNVIETIEQLGVSPSKIYCL